MASADNDNLKDLVEDWMKILYNEDKDLGAQAKVVAEELNILTDGLKKGFGVLTGYNTPDTLAYQLMEYSLFEFCEYKTEARLAAMTDLLIDKKKQEIRSFTDFKNKASKINKDFNEDWLLTEYNLSIAVGQNAAAYQRFLAEKDTVTSFVQYQTIGDSKVREQHKILDGKIFNLSDKEAMKFFPPNGFGCRCEMIQVNTPVKSDEVTSGHQMWELMNRTQSDFKNSQFAINRGDLKEVFTKAQFYTNGKLTNNLNDVTYKDYGLKKVSEMKRLKPLVLDESITAENIKELFKPVKNQNFMGFDDYLGRKLMLDKNVFDFHTKGKYLNDAERRHQLFPFLKSIIKNPDEVWYNTQDKQKNKYQSRYIKFYKGEAIIIDAEFTSGGLKIKTWYRAKKEDQLLRKGLLIRRKDGKTPTI